MPRSHIIRKAPFYDRREAGEQLADKLYDFKGRQDTVIIAIPRGGVPVGIAIARKLDLPLIVSPCFRIKHPSDPDQSIGSICRDEVVLHPDREIPSDILQHEYKRLKAKIREYQASFGTEKIVPEQKNIILVDDRLETKDTILACVQSCEQKQPDSITIAVPVISASEKASLEKRGLRVVCNISDVNPQPTAKYFEKFNRVSEESVRKLLTKTKHKNVV